MLTIIIGESDKLKSEKDNLIDEINEAWNYLPKWEETVKMAKVAIENYSEVFESIVTPTGLCPPGLTNAPYAW